MNERYNESKYTQYDPDDLDAQARVTADADQERAELVKMVNHGKMVIVIQCDKLPVDDDDDMGITMKAILDGSPYHTTQFLAVATRLYGQNINKIFSEMLPPEALQLYSQLVRAGYGG